MSSSPGSGRLASSSAGGDDRPADEGRPACVQMDRALPVVDDAVPGLDLVPTAVPPCLVLVSLALHVPELPISALPLAWRLL